MGGMSKRQKRLERLRRNPNNVTLADLRRVLEDYGFLYRQTVGSHYTFSVIIGDTTKLLVVPFRRPVKTIYIKKALELIDQVIAAQEEADEEDESNASGEGENG